MSIERTNEEWKYQSTPGEKNLADGFLASQYWDVKHKGFLGIIHQGEG